MQNLITNLLFHIFYKVNFIIYKGDSKFCYMLQVNFVKFFSERICILSLIKFLKHLVNFTKAIVDFILHLVNFTIDLYIFLNDLANWTLYIEEWVSWVKTAEERTCTELSLKIYKWRMKGKTFRVPLPKVATLKVFALVKDSSLMCVSCGYSECIWNALLRWMIQIKIYET